MIKHFDIMDFLYMKINLTDMDIGELLEGNRFTAIRFNEVGFIGPVTQIYEIPEWFDTFFSTLNKSKHRTNITFIRCNGY